MQRHFGRDHHRKRNGRAWGRVSGDAAWAIAAKASDFGQADGDPTVCLSGFNEPVPFVGEPATAAAVAMVRPSEIEPDAAL